MNQDYIKWLQNRVDLIDTKGSHDSLFKELASYNYDYILPMDENRAQDGIALRYQFYQNSDSYPRWVLTQPCTFLEFLVALAERMSFICSSYVEDMIKGIFWKLLDNMTISNLTDDEWEQLDGEKQVGWAISRVCNRTYDADGTGGLFPMAKPKQNQREIQVWYQMQQYFHDPNGEYLRTY